MKKTASRAVSLLLAMIMLLSMSHLVLADTGGVTAAELKASMQNANELPVASDPDARAARADYLPYTGYFEETFSTGAAAGRSVRIYIPEGAHIREYFVTLALPSGADVEEFLAESGWIEIADANHVCLMVLLPDDGGWGPYEQDRDYVNYMMNSAGTARRWYSIYSEFYVVGYGDGGDILQQWTAEEPLFVISQAYFDSGIDAAALEAAGEYYYVHDGQAAATSATPSTEFTFESVQKKDIPVPTYFFGTDTPAGAIDYWKYANECNESVDDGAGPLGSDVYFQNKENSKAIATAYSSVVSQVAVFDGEVDYADPAVTREVYDALTVYTRYTVTSALSNALGFRPNHKELGIEHVIIPTIEEGGRAYNRAYMVYVPETVKDKERFPDGAPVLYAFGGAGNNATQFFEASQYNEIADTYGFTVVMPSEATQANGVTSLWRIGIDEYNFVLDVMEDVNGKYGEYIDQNRVFALGHSQGGGMVNYLSMQDPELFTAYSIMAGLAQTFPEGTPPVPMYTIYGEYDTVSYATNRQNWLARNNFDEDDYVVTNPFNLPERYNNPVGYLIHPNTPEYPGDKFEKLTWYDENGIPMFNDTTAYGREHNNTVPDAWMIWEDWLSKWDRDEDGNRTYMDIPLVSSTVKLATDAHNVQVGDFIPVTVAFKEEQESNAVVLNFRFDAEKFRYNGYSTDKVENVSLVDYQSGEGWARITLMIQDYKALDLGYLGLVAKEDAPLMRGREMVQVTAEYVLRDESGGKSAADTVTSVSFTTIGDGEGGPGLPYDTNDDGVVDILDLSNMIDWFGYTRSNQSDWDDWYTYFDHNNNGEIDIQDIVHVARLINS